MINLIVGHRGVGKTSFVERVKHYYKNAGKEVLCLDLDEEIEKFQDNSISGIFQSVGEDIFREMEQDVLNNLMELYGEETKDVYISLGAGFSGELPKEAHIIWLQRPTDEDGRIFLDRPRLDPGDSSFGEYMKRYQKRRMNYMSICHEEFNLEEGFTQPNEVEPVFLGLKPGGIGGCLTLLPENFFTKKGWKKFIKKRLGWGLNLFELRDDYLSEPMLQLAMATIPHKNLLLSFREAHSEFFRGLDLSLFKWDWPLELGELGDDNPSILSLHERMVDGSLSETCKYLEQQAQGRSIYLKLAIEIDNFKELAEGHHWWLKDPENRCFLPRSENGRWAWYRNLHRHKMKVNFVREALGSSMDQPSFFEWGRMPSNFDGFAAILGSPVHHSLTPAEQAPFFAEKNQPVLRINMKESECTEENMKFMAELGLKAAAVTSPLKTAAFKLCRQVSEGVKELGSVNSLAWNERENTWSGENTDLYGLKQLFSENVADEKGPVAVWGGGGTQSVLQNLVPQAAFFSARTGELKFGMADWSEGPEVMVWAVGRSRMSECSWPPNLWSPKLVVDLNYTDDSPGKEYAEATGARYISGLKMFHAQAEAQRQFWTESINL